MNITELVQKNESKTLEFKQDFSSPDKIIRTIIAFANTSGGVILIGVEDKNKNIYGIENPLDIKEKLANLISDTISPRLIPSIEIISWRNKQLIGIEVFPSPIRPHFKTSLGEENGVLIRVGSSNRKADKQLIQELHRAARYQSFDEELVITENSEALDFRVVSELFSKVRQIEKNDLLSLKLMATYQRQEVPTNAGMILFGKERLKYFPDAWVHCGRFSGKTRRNIADVVELKTCPIYAIDQALEFSKKHALRPIEITETAKNSQRWNIPIIAIREALTNAVVHSDYSQTGVHIRLAFFDDRIEIDNPGLLYDGLTIDDIKIGISKLRNRTIGRIFKELGLIEQWGSGIQRMIEVCEEMGLPSPEFLEFGGQFRVTISLLAKQDMTIDDTNQYIVDLLRKNTKGLSVKDIAANIGLSTRTIRSRLTKLGDMGIVSAIGTGPKDPKKKYSLRGK
jgi:predicted HTH transcriptional regulator